MNCIRCGREASEQHEPIHGTANRKLSIRFGLRVWLCAYCHRLMHSHPILNQEWQRKMQMQFMKDYPELDFRKIFGKNYL